MNTVKVLPSHGGRLMPLSLLDNAARHLKYSFGARIVGLDWSVASLAPVFGPLFCLA